MRRKFKSLQHNSEKHLWRKTRQSIFMLPRANGTLYLSGGRRTYYGIIAGLVSLIPSSPLLHNGDSSLQERSQPQDQRRSFQYQSGSSYIQR